MKNNYDYDLKMKIIELYNNGNKPILLAELFNIFFKSIYNWIKLYKNNILKPKRSYIKKSSLFHNVLIRVNIKFYILKNLLYHVVKNIPKYL